MDTLLIIFGMSFIAVVTTLIAVVSHLKQTQTTVADHANEVELEAIKGHFKEEQELNKIRAIR